MFGPGPQVTQARGHSAPRPIIRNVEGHRTSVQIRLDARQDQRYPSNNGYMDAMAIATLIAAIWIVGLFAVVAMCRSAARGDHALRLRERWADSHERPLAA